MAWQTYYIEMEKLAKRIMKAFAETLSLERDFFEKYIKHPRSALRALHYPMVGNEFLKGQQRAGAHTDYGSLTILLPEEGSTGLQVIKYFVCFLTRSNFAANFFCLGAFFSNSTNNYL